MNKSFGANLPCTFTYGFSPPNLLWKALKLRATQDKLNNTYTYINTSSPLLSLYHAFCIPSCYPLCHTHTQICLNTVSLSLCLCQFEPTIPSKTHPCTHSLWKAECISERHKVMLHAALSSTVLVESSLNQAGVTDLTWQQVGRPNRQAYRHRVTERDKKAE